MRQNRTLKANSVENRAENRTHHRPLEEAAVAVLVVSPAVASRQISPAQQASELRACPEIIPFVFACFVEVDFLTGSAIPAFSPEMALRDRCRSSIRSMFCLVIFPDRLSEIRRFLIKQPVVEDWQHHGEGPAESRQLQLRQDFNEGWPHNRWQFEHKVRPQFYEQFAGWPDAEQQPQSGYQGHQVDVDQQRYAQRQSD